MNPSTREETFMRGISNVLQGNDSGVSIAPSSRTEYFLNEILTAASSGGGGGGDLYIVKFTKSGYTWSADKSLSEILQASSGDATVVGMISPDNTLSYAVKKAGDNSNVAFSFLTFKPNDDYNGLIASFTALTRFSDLVDADITTYEFSATQG